MAAAWAYIRLKCSGRNLAHVTSWRPRSTLLMAALYMKFCYVFSIVFWFDMHFYLDMIFLPFWLQLAVFISVGPPLVLLYGYGLWFVSLCPSVYCTCSHLVFFWRSCRLCDRLHWLRLVLLVISRPLESDYLWDRCGLFNTPRRLSFRSVPEFCLVCGIPYLYLVSPLFLGQY